jgi:hypothetical protein
MGNPEISIIYSSNSYRATGGISTQANQLGGPGIPWYQAGRIPLRPYPLPGNWASFR